jgi:dehydrogenase/reductase SDR family protein 7B
MADGFRDNVVWITGASSGIGEALALAFAARGARLVLSARNRESLEKVSASCKQAGAADTLVLPLDLVQQDNFPELAQEVVDRFKRIDILVNNGGVSQRSALKDTPMERYRELMEINFFGALALTKAVLPQMLLQKSGHIVVMSSMVGKIGSPKRTGYAASKHALHGLFDSLRAEVHDDNIKVLIVCPGFIRTNISLKALNAEGKPTNKMDKNQEDGMSPQVLAEKILNAISRGTQEIYVGGKEILAIHIKRFLPRLLSKIIMKRH